MEYNIEHEIELLNNDRETLRQELEREHNKLVELLKGDLGQDIKDVMSGKKKVKLSFKEKFKYKLNYYLDSLLKMF